jgi:hypothetical protein
MEAKLLAIIGSAAVAVALVGGAAMGAKEKFTRTKPHVNVMGPFQLGADALTIGVGTFLPAVQVDPDHAVRKHGECEGTIDLRVVDADDPDGPPLAESKGLQIRTDATHTLNFRPGTTAGGGPHVYAIIVVRDFDGLPGPGCLLRGQVEVLSADGCAARSLPIRAEDFVAVVP